MNGYIYSMFDNLNNDVTLNCNTGRFIMLSMITNIYNKKPKGSTLMELFTDRETEKFSVCEQFH